MFRTLTWLMLCIPILPVGRFRPRFLFLSRRRPGAWLTSPADLILNTSDALYLFFHRAPRGSTVIRAEGGEIKGHFYNQKWEKSS
ncbi:MAG: hypothetical protein ACYC2R_08675 [Burkholderiales bacterium]